MEDEPIKAYEKLENATLYNADCLSILDIFPPGEVYSVVTDPPFNKGKKFDNDNLSDIDYRAFINRFVLELFRLKPLNIVIEVPKDDRIIKRELERYFTFRYTMMLNYTNSMRQGGVGYSDFGLVYWFSGWQGDEQGKCVQRYKDRIDSPLISTQKEFQHDSPKQVLHYQALVRMFTPPGAVCLDPFIGSGTTGIACVNLGRKFIGIDISKDSFDIARKRIEKANLGESFLGDLQD